MDDATKPPTESPFLPGSDVQFAWDSTSLELFKRCPRLYEYTMIRGWKPKSESVHLRFGGEYHQALQEYDVARSNGVSHEDAIHLVTRELMIRTEGWNPSTEDKAGRYKNRTTLVSLVIDYLDHYAGDPAETFIKDDGTPAVELSFRFSLDWSPASAVSQPYLLCGHLDRVVTFNDAIMVVDHKTTTTAPGQYYFDQYEPNNQMTLYTLAGQIVLDAPVKGVIINAAQIMLEQPNRFVRGFTYRTPDQLTEWLGDLSLTLAAAEACGIAGYWPMNDTACDKYGGCRFRNICSKSPQVRERFLAADFDQLEPEERWNPLKPR